MWFEQVEPEPGGDVSISSGFKNISCRKLYYNGKFPLTDILDNVSTSIDATIPDNTPLFLRSENFTYIDKFKISDGDTGIGSTLPKASSSKTSAMDKVTNGISSGFSRYIPVHINDLSISLITNSPNYAKLTETKAPIIANVWARGLPADGSGNGATNSGEYSHYGYNPYYFTILNATNRNSMYKARLNYSSDGGLTFGSQNASTGLNISSNDNNVMNMQMVNKLSSTAVSGILIEFTPEEEDTTTPSTSTNFPKDVIRRWKLSYEYDSTMESPLSNTFEYNPSEDLDSEGNQLYADKSFKKMRLDIYFPQNLPPRSTALVVYRQGSPPMTDTEGMAYNKIKEIQLDFKGMEAVQKDGRTYYRYTLTDDGTSSGTYSGLNNDISETLLDTNLNYGISEQVNDYLFVSNFDNPQIEKGDYSIARSVQGKWSIFDWVNFVRVFKDKVTALSSFKGKLLVFTSKDTYIINPDTLAQERIIEGFGCGNKDAVVSCE